MIIEEIEINGKIYQIPTMCNADITLDDFTENTFDIEKWTKRTKKVEPKILWLKEHLQKYKEDVEQVELFGMQRDDYEEKKQMCANIVLQLRELEEQLKGE